MATRQGNSMRDVHYRYQVTGTAAEGQTWECYGQVMGHPGSFPDLLHEAMRRAFAQLCHGKATYGQPGNGCAGPYTVTGFALELEPQRKEMSR